MEETELEQLKQAIAACLTPILKKLEELQNLGYRPDGNKSASNMGGPGYEPRRTLSVKEAMAWLGFKKSQTYKLFHAGELEGYDGPGGIRFYADSVEEFKRRHANKRHSPPTPPAEAVTRPRKRAASQVSEQKPYRHLR